MKKEVTRTEFEKIFSKKRSFIKTTEDFFIQNYKDDEIKGRSIHSYAKGTTKYYIHINQ